MGLFDRNWGAARPNPQTTGAPAQTEDERAIARYRYLLNTAPPEAIEQAHADAFAQLSPEQRRQVLATLADGLPASERAQVEQSGATPQALARAATRAEMRQPGALERLFGGARPGGIGFGGMLAGSLLGSIAGTVLGSAIAQNFFDQHGDGSDQAADAGHDGGAADDAAAGDADLAGGGDFDSGGFDV